MSAGPHVLVVDDHRAIRDLVSRALTKEGFRASAVGDELRRRRDTIEAACHRKRRHVDGRAQEGCWSSNTEAASGLKAL
ncbi:MAG: response regulator [Methylobacteriaceae bacterium]|nr:response regulator [Rhodoblastus sp.]MCC0003898.1 response regulator [Methylobacteriaceae bacterium]